MRQYVQSVPAGLLQGVPHSFPQKNHFTLKKISDSFAFRNSNVFAFRCAAACNEKKNCLYETVLRLLLMFYDRYMDNFSWFLFQLFVSSRDIQFAWLWQNFECLSIAWRYYQPTMFDPFRADNSNFSLTSFILDNIRWRNGTSKGREFGHWKRPWRVWGVEQMQIEDVGNLIHLEICPKFSQASLSMIRFWAGRPSANCLTCSLSTLLITMKGFTTGSGKKNKHMPGLIWV